MACSDSITRAAPRCKLQVKICTFAIHEQDRQPLTRQLVCTDRLQLKHSLCHESLRCLDARNHCRPRLSPRLPKDRVLPIPPASQRPTESDPTSDRSSSTSIKPCPLAPKIGQGPLQRRVHQFICTHRTPSLWLCVDSRIRGFVRERRGMVVVTVGTVVVAAHL